MFKLAIVQPKTLPPLKNLIVYTMTPNELFNNEWNDWCIEKKCTIEIIKEEFEYLPDCEYIFHFCILKTFWLNIFKRIWRKKHAQIVKRRKIHNLWNRSIYGKWLS